VVAVAGRVLIVDDEPDIRRSLADLLGYLPDCETVIAQGFQDGLAKARQGGWDIIISDERMPDGRGVDLLTQLSRELPDTHRVLMSAFSDFDMLLRGLNAGHIDHFIQKPWDPTHVLEWVEKTMKERAAWGHARPVRHSPFKRVGMGAIGGDGATPAALAAQAPPAQQPLTIVRRALAPRPIAVAAPAAAPLQAPVPVPAPSQAPHLAPAPAPPAPEPGQPALTQPALAPQPAAPLQEPAPAIVGPAATPALLPASEPARAPPAPELGSPPLPAAAPTAEQAARNLDNHLAGIAEVLRWAAESKSGDEKLLYVRMALKRLEGTQRTLETMGAR
jgi:DNA-binding NarL/FixJ family response regulator